MKKRIDRMAANHGNTYLTAMLAVVVGLIVLVTVVVFCTRSIWYDPQGEDIPAGSRVEEGDHPYADGPVVNGEDRLALIPFAPDEKISVIHKTHELNSGYAALVDVTAGEVIASSHADEKIYPASMTKVMSLIVVVEHLTENSLGDYITVTKAVAKDMAEAEANIFGFTAGQQFTVEEMMYAMMLESDGVATVELARYIAGTEEAFVEIMNQKAKAMGLVNTHFTNAVGLQDEMHYSTCREIASIMSYAMQMSLCRQILSTDTYRFDDAIDGHAAYKGYFFHSLLHDRLDGQPANQPSRLTVVAGKTGYAGDESGYCLVTYAEDANGKAYICVTAKAKNGMSDCVKDYQTIYDNFAQ